MPDRKPQMFTACFVNCPYLRQCGTMVAKGNDSWCRVEIGGAIPDSAKLLPNSVDKVKALNDKGELIAEVERGHITKI